MRIFDMLIKYLDLKIENGFFRKDTDTVAMGLFALYEGLTINNLLGTNELYNKKSLD
jgi:hypothetical protein